MQEKGQKINCRAVILECFIGPRHTVRVLYSNFDSLYIDKNNTR